MKWFGADLDSAYRSGHWQLRVLPASLTIGILLCGGFPATLEAQFGSYSSMVRKLLGSRSAAVFAEINLGLRGLCDHRLQRRSL